MGRRAGRSLIRGRAFWDSSALVPLCTGQAATPRAAAHYRNFGVVVWWGTSVEIAAAFARLLRMKQLSAANAAKALDNARRLASDWTMVAPSEPIRLEAENIAGRFDLKAADSLQLSAALEWCNNMPQGRVFLTADQRLRQAASLSGFDAKMV